MTAFKAVYADWKLIKTRGTVQVVLEVPVEQADAAYEVLGGMPVAGKERWFGVAALKPETEVMPSEQDQFNRRQPDMRPDPVDQPRPDRAKRPYREMMASQQAALRCNDATFQAFLREQRTADWKAADAWEGVEYAPDSQAAEVVRAICGGIPSRADLNVNHKARVIWHQLDSQYQAWLAKERVA